MGLSRITHPIGEGKSGFNPIHPHIHTPYYNYDESIIKIDRGYL
jgi:hypothetical protein